MNYEGGPVLVVRSALEQLDHVMAAVMDALGGQAPEKMYDLALSKHPAAYLFGEDEIAASAVESWMKLAIDVLNCTKVVILRPTGDDFYALKVGNYCLNMLDLLEIVEAVEDAEVHFVQPRNVDVKKLLGHCIDGRFVYGHMVNDGYPVRETALWRIPGIFSTFMVHPDWTLFLTRDIQLLLDGAGVGSMDIFMHETCGMQAVHRGEHGAAEWAQTVHSKFWHDGLGCNGEVFSGQGQWAVRTEQDSFVLAPYAPR
ncbi:MAG: hypothetical protein AB8A39_05345 [Prochlorococcus sp.]